jgi:predicted TIM-barrel fold metal-dependent hydrolase
MRFPFSAGDLNAQTQVPALSCDCHIHVYDEHTEPITSAVLRPPAASLEDYARVQRRMGTERAVLVTPSTYGFNNTPVLNALSHMGSLARGVAVISGQESDEELTTLHGRGVRGVRINLSLGRVHTVEDIEPIAQRIKPLGWHLQLLMPNEQLLAAQSVLRRLSVPLVLDHFARMRAGQATFNATHALVLELLGQGRAWIKLSGGYLVSEHNAVDDPLLTPLAQSLIRANPEQIIWGSDWPHVTASAGHHPMPDDAQQIDQLAAWATNKETLERILVTNPAKLYNF